MAQRKKIALIATLCVLSAGSAFPQQSDDRYPAQGLSILDCAPVDPAPEDSCTLRVPPGHRATNLQADATGDLRAEFQIAREGGRRFPEGLTQSATILLVDLSPGPNRGRAATFETEKTVIGELVEGLPSNELVAIYGFNEELRLLQDFTTNTNALRSTVQALSLGGSNTLIGPYVSQAISILDERDDVLFRNVLLVSDGDDESGQSVSEIVAEAVDKQVMISTLGTFWRTPGAAENGAGTAYLLSLAQGTLGQSGQATLRRPQDAGQAVGEFIEAYSQGLRSSGLIVPVDDAREARISLVLEEPVPGRDSLRPRDISVLFTPSAAPAGSSTEPEEDPGAEEGLLFGFPAIYSYVAGALAALALLLLLILLRRNKPGEGDLDEALVIPAEEGAAIDIDEEAETKLYTPAEAAPAVSAYLVFEDNFERGAVVGSRVNIGRSKSNEIVIDGESISRLHAQIYRNRDGGFSISDMDSLNGTFINGTKVTGTQPVGLGDIITFGKVRAKLMPA